MSQGLLDVNNTQNLSVAIGKPINGSIANNASLLENIIEPSFWSEYRNHVILGIVLLLILFRLFRKKTSGQRNIVYLVGERNAGKTQLIYLLSKGAKAETVPSIKNNVTEYRLGERKSVELADIAGSNHTKEQFLSNIQRALAIVQVVDGSNAESLLGTADLLYKILISKNYQKNQPNHIIFLNKSDSAGFLGQKMFQKKLEDEMQRIKLSRRTMVEEKQGEEDTIKEEKGRWSLGDCNIKVVTGSVLNGETAELEKLLSEK